VIFICVFIADVFYSDVVKLIPELGKFKYGHFLHNSFLEKGAIKSKSLRYSRVSGRLIRNLRIVKEVRSILFS
jgi:hypothetical protein